LNLFLIFFIKIPFIKKKLKLKKKKIPFIKIKKKKNTFYKKIKKIKKTVALKVEKKYEIYKLNDNIQADKINIPIKLIKNKTNDVILIEFLEYFSTITPMSNPKIPPISCE
jgi:hypothetical protein